MIGFYGIPALNETVETIINSEEIYLGYKIDNNFSDKFKKNIDGIIAGVVSYEYKDNILEICKMVVDPIFFRKGIGESLLKYMVENIGINLRIRVFTGTKNIPAKNLYKKYGFKEIEEIEVEKEVYITLMEYFPL